MIENVNVNIDEKFAIDDNAVMAVIEALKTELKFNIDSIEINFLDENYILELNREYLNHDYNTDIITFNYSGDNDMLDGEIFISVDDAFNNADLYNVEKNNELLRLIIHGFLHLLGYDDSTDEEKKIQKALEDQLVNKYSYLAKKLCAVYD